MIENSSMYLLENWHTLFECFEKIKVLNIENCQGMDKVGYRCRSFQTEALTQPRFMQAVRCNRQALIRKAGWRAVMT